MSLFARGNKLYAKVKSVDGKWQQLATGFSVGEEDAARKFLEGWQRKIDAARSSGAAAGPLTVAGYSKRWLEQRRKLVADAKNDEQRLRMHVLPKIGEMHLTAVRPQHLVELFREIREQGKIAPRTIYNVYSVVSAMFRDARIADLIEQTPCILTSHQLGPLSDKDPTRRGDAVFTRGEVERLIGDSRIASDRKVVYGLGALAGLRHGETAGLRWHHYDSAKEPLGQLTIATSYDHGKTKTGVVRRVPVHPVLAALLAEWRLSGWAAVFGRQPGPDDLIVPLPPDPPKKQARPNPRAGGMRSAKDTGKRWDTDLATLGLRHRRGHDLRATFITLCEDAGADPHVLARLTHTARGRSAYAGYSRTQWETLCREVAKLEITRPELGRVIELPLAVNGDPEKTNPPADSSEFGAPLVQRTELFVISGGNWRSGRDLNAFPSITDDAARQSFGDVATCSPSPIVATSAGTAPNLGAAEVSSTESGGCLHVVPDRFDLAIAKLRSAAIRAAASIQRHDFQEATAEYAAAVSEFLLQFESKGETP